jgi:hypothetical protein
VEKELQHEGISELIVTETMGQRKAKMLELGEVFLAFPGGVGTLEEISEVMSREKNGAAVQTLCLFGFRRLLPAPEGYAGKNGGRGIRVERMGRESPVPGRYSSSRAIHNEQTLERISALFKGGGPALRLVVGSYFFS